MSEPGGRASSAPLVGGDAEPTLSSFPAPVGGLGRSRRSTCPTGTSTFPKPRSKCRGLPEVGEHDLVMHFTRLAHRNFAVDLGAYPLGSCTMKYNPKVCDWAGAHPGFAGLHPTTPADRVQGALEVLLETERILCDLTGMARATFQPPAGAAGELTGLMIMRAHHQANGDPRTKILIPDSAHGTNPASVTLAGYRGRRGAIQRARHGLTVGRSARRSTIKWPV